MKTLAQDSEMKTQSLTIVPIDFRPIFGDEYKHLYLIYRRGNDLPIFYLYKNERLAHARCKQLNEKADAVVWFIKPIEVEDE